MIIKVEVRGPVQHDAFITGRYFMPFLLYNTETVFRTRLFYVGWTLSAYAFRSFNMFYQTSDQLCLLPFKGVSHLVADTSDFIELNI